MVDALLFQAPCHQGGAVDFAHAFLLLDGADADRFAKCRQGPRPKKSPPADYAFMAGPGKGVSPANTCYPAIAGAASLIVSCTASPPRHPSRLRWPATWIAAPRVSARN